MIASIVLIDSGNSLSEEHMKREKKFSSSRLHRAMQRAHMDAQTLSDRASAGGRAISLRVIERIISGRQMPNKDQVVRLAEATEIDVDLLYEQVESRRRYEHPLPKTSAVG